VFVLGGAAAAHDVTELIITKEVAPRRVLQAGGHWWNSCTDTRAISQLDAACCGLGGCTGVPSNCVPSCAALFVPFYESCGADLRTTQYDHLYAMCGASDCVDQDKWQSTAGNVTCKQYAVDAPESWHAMCKEHKGAIYAVSAAAPGGGGHRRRVQTPITGSDGRVFTTAAESCPLACGTCPSCSDHKQNRDEAGVDCGGSLCPPCHQATSCGPLNASRMISPNVTIDCTGEAVGDTCSSFPNVGFVAATVAELAQSCRLDAKCSSIDGGGDKAGAMVERPGTYTCGNTGTWEGVALKVVSISASTCPPAVVGLNYHGACESASAECQAKCDPGFYPTKGDGVFSCLHGAWMGSLMCAAFDCGLTLDGAVPQRSAFVPCSAASSRVGNSCVTSCASGFFAAVGTGTATFECTPLANDPSRAVWMERGFSPWWQSSLQCTRCATIENCRSVVCSTGADAQCLECETGYYGFRHDEEPTRCLPISVTLEAAGFVDSAAGLFTVTLADGSVPRDLASGSLQIPSTAALTLVGTSAAQPPQLGATYIIQGTLDLVGCGGTIGGVGVVAGGAFSVDGSSTLVATATTQRVLPCTAVASPNGTLATDCSSGLIIDVWDSGGTLNTNGVTFTLFLLPPRPPDFFFANVTGTERYAAACDAVGLRTVATGHGAYSSNCALYKCMPLPDWGTGNSFLDAIHQNTGWDKAMVHLGGGSPGLWSSVPCCTGDYYDCATGAHTSGNAGCYSQYTATYINGCTARCCTSGFDSSAWYQRYQNVDRPACQQQLYAHARPVCGVEHAA
jgi:hypothetical protein